MHPSSLLRSLLVALIHQYSLKGHVIWHPLTEIQVTFLHLRMFEIALDHVRFSLTDYGVYRQTCLGFVQRLTLI